MLNAASRLIKIFINEARKPEVFGLFVTAIAVILAGSVFYHYVEGWSFLDSFLFSVSTLATVGVGELFPETTIGKIFTSFYMLIGIGILFGFISMVGREVTGIYTKNHNESEQKRIE